MANIPKKRILINEQPPEERIKNFDEVSLGYSPEQSMLEAERCLQCKDPPCVKGCLVAVDVKSFVKELAEGNFRNAFLTIKKNNPMPATIGRVCPQENFCERVCTLGNIGDPINIGRLEAFLGDWAIKNNIDEEIVVPENDKTVAIIGSGPSGVSCAVNLRKFGYKVAIYEALHKAGGVLQYGIPEFRLPKTVVDKELMYLEKLGVNIHLNKIIGQNMNFEEILTMYDAIYICTGAGAPCFMKIKGEYLNGVYSANEFLIRVNLMKAYKFPHEYDTPIVVGKRVAVIGAGDVAMDTARCARRLGAKVYLIFRRTSRGVPARMEEVKRTLDEGIEMMELVKPTSIIGKDGWVNYLELIRIKLGEPDDSGKRRPLPVEGSDFLLEVDTVIEAIGTRPNKLFLDRVKIINTNKWGEILVNDSLSTSVDGIFAGGDAISGGATVIQALGEGRKAAKSIHEYLLHKKRVINA